MANLAVGACAGMPDRADHLSSKSQPSSAALSHELHHADLDYRSLALHAGLLHSMTVEAKQRAARLTILLFAAMERQDHEPH